jgi:hypothetical protein
MGVSAAKVCARCGYSMAVFLSCGLGRVLSGVLGLFRKTRDRRAWSAQATGTQAEFKRDFRCRPQHEPLPEFAGLLT